jgi:hypothetical protein
VAGKQAQDGVGQCALAAAGFSENAQDFATAKVERDVIESVDGLGAGLSVCDAEALNA